VAADAQDGAALLHAVETLRRQVDELALPLELPGVVPARQERRALRAQLDDYVLPRLRSQDAPLLAVVGGSTGAGKSTLVNSIVGQIVTRSGVLRPTTRSPVLVHHPADLHWFTGKRVLADLPRVTGDSAGGTGGAGVTDDAGRAVRMVASTALPPGLALLDAPDIDSVVEANRGLARQLLAAADLWLFVTSAARYADAVPWDLLSDAARRGTSLAMVLDRVAPQAIEEIRADLSHMLRNHGLGNAPLFVVPEVTLDGELLPDDVIERLRSWLTALALDAKARSMVARRTMHGTLGTIDLRVETLVGAAQAQRDGVTQLRTDVGVAYDAASHAVALGLTDGTLLRGEVLARWQEFVGTGELLRNLESGVGRLRDRIRSKVRGRPSPTEELGEALQTGVAALVTAQAREAAAEAARRWRGNPAGLALLSAHPGLDRPADGLTERVDRLVRDWQGFTLELVRDEGGRRRSAARVLSYGVNGLGVVLMLVVFSQTYGLSGAEVGIAGGTAVVAQRLLEAVFGDQAVRMLAVKARQDLQQRVDALFAGDRERLDDVLDALELDSRPTALDQALQLSTAVDNVAAAR
jgi:energy-coupling factor transporter ATP-binding protein EcfA2